MVGTERGPNKTRASHVEQGQIPAGFWDLWRAKKDELKSLGLSAGKDQKTDEWELCWWQEISAEVVEARAVAVEMSRASSADVVLPCPAGLDSESHYLQWPDTLVVNFAGGAVKVGKAD